MKLTKKQQAQVEVYKEKYRKIGLSTEPTNRALAEDAFARDDKFHGRPTRKVIWTQSPYTGIRIAAQLHLEKDNPTPREIAAQVDMASYGSFNAYWVAYHSFIAYELGDKKSELIDIVNDLIKEVGVYWAFEDTIVATDKPTRIEVDGTKLHSVTGKAIEYADGTGLYAVNGQRVASLVEAALDGALTASVDKN